MSTKKNGKKKSNQPSSSPMKPEDPTSPIIAKQVEPTIVTSEEQPLKAGVSTREPETPKKDKGDSRGNEEPSVKAGSTKATETPKKDARDKSAAAGSAPVGPAAPVPPAATTATASAASTKATE